MKRNVFVAVLIVLVALPAFADSPVRSEAKVYFSDYNQLVDRLGGLLGELDICTRGTTQNGGQYLVVFCDADQLGSPAGKRTAD